jgi:hypothetical protein
MTLIAFGAAKGAPGVSTTVLALAACWPAHRQPLIVEADPSGGDLLSRLGTGNGDRPGVDAAPSTVQLAAAARDALSAQTIGEHLQTLPGAGEIRALVAPTSPFAAHTALTTLVGAGLGDRLAELDGVDLLVDLGRIDPTSPALGLLQPQSRLVLVARPDLESVLHTRELERSLNALRVRTSLLLIGDRPYSPADIATALGGVPVVGVLPDDPVGARALAGDARSPKVVGRCRLVRAAGHLATAFTPEPEVTPVESTDAAGSDEAAYGPALHPAEHHSVGAAR